MAGGEEGGRGVDGVAGTLVYSLRFFGFLGRGVNV